jgi:ADP-ribose pyrophosphatase YjhB (NUDIX family)
MGKIERLFEDLPRVPLERRWGQQLWPTLGVVSLIRRRHPRSGLDRYLLIQRKQPPYAGKWALVGGKVEFGETLAQAVQREVEEETGLEVAFLGLRGIVNERLASANVADPAGHFVLFVCAVSAPNGTPSEQLEGRVAWFTLAEIDALHASSTIIPSDYAMLRQFSQVQDALPYVEAEMVTTRGAQTRTALMRFEEVG